MTTRVLELYCGIGGCAAALGPEATVVAAVDVNRKALDVYSHNFPHPVEVRAIESLGAADLERWDAHLWWLSPPCQPFTRRGLARDDADPRSASLLHLIDLLGEAPPPALALENVPGFAGSRTHGRLRASLDRQGYDVREREICPSQLGVPNRRRRFYLLAWRDAGHACLAAGRPDGTPRSRAGDTCREDRARAERHRRPLAAYLDAEPDPALWPPAGLLRRYRHAIDLVDAADPAAVTACFTSAYGRSPVRSGSYLVTRRGPRRFSPAEILRLLGFPGDYRLPPELPLDGAWRLAGNSLSVDAVRRLFGELADQVA